MSVLEVVMPLIAGAGIAYWGIQCLRQLTEISKGLRALTLEIELTRKGALQEIPAAIYDHTKQLLHTVR
jgi:hypothetical protein